MEEVKFTIRDQSGHTTKLVHPDQADELADELRDQGYMIVRKKTLIPYGASLEGEGPVEAIPLATKG